MIGPVGAQTLASQISVLKSLQELDLSSKSPLLLIKRFIALGNDIEDEGASAVFSALVALKSLHELLLDGS